MYSAGEQGREGLDAVKIPRLKLIYERTLDLTGRTIFDYLDSKGYLKWEINTTTAVGM